MSDISGLIESQAKDGGAHQIGVGPASSTTGSALTAYARTRTAVTLSLE